MSYDQPDKGEGFKPSDHPEWMGQIFLIWPTSEETVNFTRDNGEADPTLMVTADVAIVTVTDAVTGKPVFIKDAKIGGKGLAPAIRPNKPNRKILGKMAWKQAAKGKTYFLEVPDSASPEWAQMVTFAEQYEAANPRQAYSAPTPAAAPVATPAPWGAPPPAPGAPAPAWGSPVAQLTNQWPAPPAPPANNAASWPPGLADFLTSKGYDITQIPDEGTARQIAATLSN